MATKFTTADIKLQTVIPYIEILDMTVTSEMGKHGTLSLTLRVKNDCKPADMQRYFGSEISVVVDGAGMIFCGICTNAGLANFVESKSVVVTAKSQSYQLDKDKKNQTFQDPGKTLQQVVDQVAGSLGGTVVLDSDQPVPKVLSQDNETAFGFISRIGASFGKALFVNTGVAYPEIYLGKTGFRSFGEDVLGEMAGNGRDVTEMGNASGAGQSAEGFMFDSQRYFCKTVAALAGDKIGDRVIRKSVIRAKNASLTNEVTLMYEEGVRPSTEDSTKPELQRSVLTGTVMTVSENQIQVQLDRDAGAGSMVWVPYESVISNSFYCMPDEGDIVFLYYENNGNFVCLGSKHVNTGHPDFQKPSEKVLTNHDKMLKLGDQKLTLTATRSLTDEENPNEISIVLDDEKGVMINSGMDISIKADKNLIMKAGKYGDPDCTEAQEGYAAGKENLTSRHQDGNAKYVAESGDIAPGAVLKTELGTLRKDFCNNVRDTVRGMVMADMFETFLGGGNEEEPVPEEVTPVETGSITLYGYQQLKLQVGNSCLIFDPEFIEFNTPSFKWLGYDRMEHAKEEIPLQDWWETALDGLQMVLDVCGMIPGVGCFFDLASGVISLCRGDFMGAAMSFVSAIPGIGDAVGGAKLAVKGTKLAVKTMSKAERIMHMIQGIYMMAQGAWALYQQKDQLKDLWERFQEGGLSAIANPQDISLLFNTMSSTATMLKGAKSTAEGMVGKKVTLTNPEAEAQKRQIEEQKKRDKAENKCGDPINVVTGSFSLKYVDLQLRDVTETFVLERRHESVYTNHDMMLGNRWYLNIETRMQHTDEGHIVVQRPDMSLVKFEKTGQDWVNERENDRSCELFALKDGYQFVDHEEQKKYYYDKEGRVSRIADRFGNESRFTYEGDKLVQFLLASGAYLNFTYHNGLLKTITTNDGRKLSYEYAGKLLVRVDMQNNTSIHYEYDSIGNIISITDQNGHKYVMNEYDRRNRVVKQTTAAGHEFLFFYDDKNKQTVFSELNAGERTVYSYDAREVVTGISYEDGTTERFEYDRWENCIYHQDRNGNETYYTYDVYGNQLYERQPGGLIITREYDRNHNIIHQFDNAGQEVIWEYDEDGKLTAEKLLLEKGRYAKMGFAYDTKGRIITYRNPNGQNVDYVYDNISEPILKRNPEGETYQYEYDEAGRLLSERILNAKVKYGYNRSDAVSMFEDEDGNITRYTYDGLGNRTSIIPPNQNGTEKKISIRYTVLDEIERITTAEGNVYQYLYGQNGLLKKEIHPNAFSYDTEDGEGTSYDYDTSGRLIRIHFADGGIKRFFLDGNGNVVKKVMPAQYDPQTDDGAGYLYEYDREDRLVKVTDPKGTVTNAFVYDLAGNLVKEIDGNGYQMGETDEERAGILYRYNYAGWVTEVRKPLERAEEDDTIRYQLTRYLYNDMGGIVTEERFVDAQTEESTTGRIHSIRYRYDRSNRLVEVSDSTGAAILYEYDAYGNRSLEKVRVDEESYRETHYEYSLSGRLVAEKVKIQKESESGQTSDTANESEADFAITRYSYDANGNVTRVILPEGGIIEYSYDADDRLIGERHTEPGGEIDNRICYSYDKADNRTEVTDVNGNTTRYSYDYRNQNTEILNADGGKVKFVYDKNGNLVKRYTPMQTLLSEKNSSQFPFAQKQDPCWQYRYDLSDQLTEVISPDNVVRNRMQYDAAGNLTGSTDALGSGIRLSYDLAGRRTLASTANGVSQGYEYNALGANSALIDSNGKRTEFVLDHWGRITGVRKADGSEETYEYDLMGNMLKSTDGNGFSVSYRYDTRGNMVTRIDATGAREHFLYDREDRMIGHTDRNGNYTRISYNMYGSITRRVAVRPEHTGNVNEIQNRLAENGSIAALNAGRENGIHGTIQESFGYLPDGKLSHAISNGMRYEYAYDCMNRLVRKTASGKMLLENRYDLNGNRIGRKDISGKETVYEYDHLDRMSKVVDNGHESVIYQYNNNGTIKKMITGGMIITEYTYDADQNITGQKTYVDESKAVKDERLSPEGTIKNLSLGSKVGNSNLIVDNTYRYDNLGNLAEKKTLSGLTSYTYDAQNRLTRIVTPKGSEDYTYDRAGNRLSRILKNNDHSVRRHETYAYDAANRLLERNVAYGDHDTTATGTVSNAVQGKPEAARTLKTEYSYDKQGNMTAEKTTASDAYGTREQKTRTFRYDAVNRLSEVLENGKCLQKNTYDAEGLRSEMEENDRLVKFLYDGDKVIAERDDTKGLKRYIRGYELVSSDCEQARTYYHYASDELGSITDVLNYKGEVLNHYEYDAFGEFSVREEQVENRFAFAGEQFDPATNLYYLRARFYNPVIGRFIQEDTYYGDGLNLYAYCHNNPVGYVDPSGHACDAKTESIKLLEERFAGSGEDHYKLLRNFLEADEIRSLLEGKDTLNSKNLKKLRKKIESGTLDYSKAMTISHMMGELGLSQVFEDNMKKMNFGKYLKNLIGNGDPSMARKHAHHILFKNGLRGEQKALVARGQKILRKYGIDPVIGKENLVWAPNIKGQHTTQNLRNIVESLEKLENEGASYSDIMNKLAEYGVKAAGRR